MNVKGPHAVFSLALRCYWLGARVIGPHALAFDLPPLNCTDMKGAIRLAQLLMPGVGLIETYVDGKKDTCYVNSHGDWRAIRP